MDAIVKDEIRKKKPTAEYCKLENTKEMSINKALK